MVDCGGEDLARLVQAAASIEQVINLGAGFGPFLNLVEVAISGSSVSSSDWCVLIPVGSLHFAEAAKNRW
jgi:hypothetical protein